MAVVIENKHLSAQVCLPYTCVSLELVAQLRHPIANVFKERRFSQLM